MGNTSLYQKVVAVAEPPPVAEPPAEAEPPADADPPPVPPFAEPQTAATHCCPLVHVTQAFPLPPQNSVELPTSQRPEPGLQQPVGQLVASQGNFVPHEAAKTSDAASARERGRTCGGLQWQQPAVRGAPKRTWWGARNGCQEKRALRPERDSRFSAQAVTAVRRPTSSR